MKIILNIKIKCLILLDHHQFKFLRNKKFKEIFKEIYLDNFKGKKLRSYGQKNRINYFDYQFKKKEQNNGLLFQLTFKIDVESNVDKDGIIIFEMVF